LTIGEAAIAADAAHLQIRIFAAPATDAACPVPAATWAGSPDNSVSLSALWFGDFVARVGLIDLFHGQGWNRSTQSYGPCSAGFHREAPLITTNPGMALLCAHDLAVVTAARERRQAMGPDPDDDHLGFLLWLEFWIGRALATCKVPVLYND
jgi:hypothetical protein